MDEDPPPRNENEANSSPDDIDDANNVPSSPSSMDWVKVDGEDDTIGMVENLGRITSTAGSAAAAEETSGQLAATAVAMQEEVEQNFDDYSFGSSSDEEDDNGLAKMADVSLATAFDMQILQASIEESADALDLVRDKDVVMVVGKTGVGKSTLIQGIAGKRIHTVSHTSSFSGETATKTVYGAQDALEDFEIGHGKVSKTRSLSAFVRHNVVSGRDYVYLDSPGLEDTRGVEMDIATSALLSQVAKRCRSLRFVILIHCASLLEDRGNAFRAIIKFAKRFVQDFVESKWSFMFLFTHTDEIGMSRSSEDAESKKRLQGEIVHIAEAATDEELSKVLSFVGKSLKKDYPFANILHPLDTDYETLALVIEQKLLPLKNLDAAGICNLTLPSKYKLEVAVQNLLQRLQVTLNSSPSDITPIKDIQKTFHYLNEYVGVPSVCDAARKSEAIIYDHQVALKRSIESEYERWTNSSSDFTEGNATALKEALKRLELFDSTFTTEVWVESKADALSALQEGIMTRVTSFRSFDRQFQKLRVWTRTFEECSGYYTDLCKSILSLLEDTMHIISQTEIFTIHDLREEELALFVDKYLILYTMGDFSEQKHVPDFEHASLRREKILDDVMVVFSSGGKKASEMAESNSINFEDDLGDIASYARFLEMMKYVTEKHGIGVNSLDKIINASLKSLEDDVTSLFQSCCEEMKKSDFDPSSVRLQLRWMQDTCRRFSTLQSNCGSELYSLFIAVVNKIKSSLLSTSGELQTMSQFTQEHGMSHGEKLGKEVASFMEWRWFDAFLPQGEAFVTNCCIAIKRAIQTRIDAKSMELSQSADCLGKGDSAEAIARLGMLLPELNEIDDYLAILEKGEHPTSSTPRIIRDVDSDDSICNTRSCSACGSKLPKTEFSKTQWHKGETARCKSCVESKNTASREGRSSTVEDVAMEDAESLTATSKVSSLAPKCVKCLQDYTSTLSVESSRCIGEWTDKVQRHEVDSLFVIAQKLDFISVDATALNQIHSIEDIFQESERIISRITTACTLLSDLVDSELSRFGGDFLLKASILNLIATCNSLPQIGRNVPVSSEVQVQVRNLVACEAQRLESEIEATSDWDKIDKQIELFQRAVVLDDFVSGEATARLSTLNRLREKKEGQVDEHLQSMISAHNFKGIAEFLTPLSGSKDQIKKQRFQSYLDDIAFNLDLTIKDVKRCMNQDSSASRFKALPSDEDAIRFISQKMTILATAKDNLHRLVQAKIDLASEFNKLGTIINNGLRPLLDQFLEYIQKKDFVRAAVSDGQVSVVIQHLGRYIQPPTLKNQKAVNEKYERELNDVLGYVDKFVHSSFRNKNDLLKSLTSLREAKDSSDTSLERLAFLYDKTRQLLLDKVRDFVAVVREAVTSAECFDDVIPILHVLQREMSGPFKTHFPNDIVLETNNLLERLQQEKKEHDRLLEFGDSDVKEKIGIWRKKLDKLQSPGMLGSFKRFVGIDDKRSYNNLKGDLTWRCEQRLKQANDALRSRDLRLVQDCTDFLVLVEQELCAHIDIGTHLQQLQERCIKAFLDLCDQVGKTLKKKDISKFEEKFVDYRGFVLNIRSISTSKKCQKDFALVNQMVYESFVRHVDRFHALVKAETLDVSDIRSKVLQLRKMGEFMADRVTLLNEEMKYSMADKDLDRIQDQWLDKIQDLCSKHFSGGRDFGKMKCCVDLGVGPSATQKEIKSAYREKAKLFHPDKPGGSAEMFRKIKDAQDELLASNRFKSSGRPQAFDGVLKGLGEHLRALSRQFMQEQRYDMAESLLFQLPALKDLDNLVQPKLKSKEVQASVRDIIKGHVEKMRVEVDSAWSERRYKDLNDSIADLKAMESRFKSYPAIFSTSWNDGIVETIEAEILELGKKAKECLSSHAVAKKKEMDFKRYFVALGFVLVELPSFKTFTRHEMSNILDSCLENSWGHSFLFEFGLSMQKGDDSTDDDEKRIAQMTVAEFDHFKEVLTMCWNQETSQKPVEDVVKDITGYNRLSSRSTEKMNIDQDELIESFKLYDTQYKSLLGEYIKPDADLPDLVKKVKVLAKKLQPISCDKIWTNDEKKHIPVLLAGVFSLFTILKSGASFNRIEEAGGSATFGDQLLMKPHNIQVLTLLYMFGCGKGTQSSLESQLMQIRTGEGKSMILGAAAAMLALLGFRVRTVCYSEYLSSRDFHLFEEVFQKFGVLDLVKYSKITTFAEDSTASKGNIRDLTESLLRGDLSSATFGSAVFDAATAKSPQRRLRSNSATKKKKQKTSTSFISRIGASIEGIVGQAFDALKTSAPEEILLVDEVDVFFGAEFYGKTYNQVIEFKEPEIVTILKRIWDAHSKGGHRLRLNDVKAMSDYKRLLTKMASFGYLLDNEINLMLNQVKRVDDVPYFLDVENDRIGYKVMDSISYNVTFGYATIFAYLKEVENLKNKGAALSRALVMPISCGQFSYANISPTRIMGVSGTLAAIGEYEKKVLDGYGLSKYIFVPSVYGESNFQFDKAGDGICFESSKSNFYHKISAEIVAATKSKRAVIVFFRDRSKLNEFIGTATYRQLGRHKSLLTEDMTPRDKDFVINKAATAGQITLSTAVFGRGTDFFCKDDSVEKNGGVHIIQVRRSQMQ